MAFKVIEPRHVEHIEEYFLMYDYLDMPGAGCAFPCDKDGNVKLSEMHPEGIKNYNECKAGRKNMSKPYIEDCSRDYMHDEVRECSKCKSTASFSRYCGAFVCDECNLHDGLARCYCGWSLSGRNGYDELVEMGENIEEDY